MSKPDNTFRPRLAPGVRLHHDKVRGGWILLAPEAMIEVNGPALEILKLCDGKHGVEEIIDELDGLFTAGRAQIEAETRAFLAELEEQKLVKP